MFLQKSHAQQAVFQSTTRFTGASNHQSCGKDSRPVAETGTRLEWRQNILRKRDSSRSHDGFRQRLVSRIASKYLEEP
eukprot:7725417-Pyramimonas_sp.AAC.1